MSERVNLFRLGEIAPARSKTSEAAKTKAAVVRPTRAPRQARGRVQGATALADVSDDWKEF